MIHPLRTSIKTLWEHGLSGLVRLLRYYSYRVGASLSRGKVECPICLWQGKAFEPFLLQPCWVRPNAICPACGSLERHRYLFLFYRMYLEQHKVEGLRCLHFAPEECLASLFRTTGLEYLPSDYKGPGDGDMQCIGHPDASIDWVISHHVLEHVEDDRRALAEVWRVLRPGGVFHLAVPVTWHLQKTRVYTRPTEATHGHWREYGCDITELFSSYAWNLAELPPRITPEQQRRYGLAEREPFFELRKPGGQAIVGKA